MPNPGKTITKNGAVGRISKKVISSGLTRAQIRECVNTSITRWFRESTGDDGVVRFDLAACDDVLRRFEGGDIAELEALCVKISNSRYLNP